MYTRKIFTHILSLLFREGLWVLALFLLMAGGCREVMFDIDAIETDDFDIVRSSIEPDIAELFDQARQEFARGEHWYELGSRSSHERYGIQNLHIIQFEWKNGTVYEVLFAFTGVIRGFGQGYYYTPSGKLPPRAPRKGVVCSKHMDDFWDYNLGILYIWDVAGSGQGVGCMTCTFYVALGQMQATSRSRVAVSL